MLIPTLLREAATEAIRAYLASREERLIRDFSAAEVASVLSRLVRMRLRTAAESAARLVDFAAWRAVISTAVDIHAADAGLAYSYTKRFDLRLRAPDALHLAIAHRHGATLVTLDRRLAQAAAALGILAHMPQE